MTMPDFVEPVSSSPEPRPPISPENLRVKQPTPGPDEKCDEYTNKRLKEVCGQPAVGYVSLPATDALPNGVRIALCETHLALHNGRRFSTRATRG